MAVKELDHISKVGVGELILTREYGIVLYSVTSSVVRHF